MTINDAEIDGERRPFEIFVNSKNMEHYAWTVGLTRMISAVFRRGGDVSFVPEELKAVFDPRGGGWINGRYVPSLLAAIGGVIERHLIGEAAERKEARRPRTASPQRRVRDRLLPPLRRRDPAAQGGLRHLHGLRLLEVRLTAWPALTPPPLRPNSRPASPPEDSWPRPGRRPRRR